MAEDSAAVRTLDGTEELDLVTTFDSAHDQARPDLALRGIASSLRPGGTYPCVEIAASSTLAGNLDRPLAPMVSTISCKHCMTVSLAQGGLGVGAIRANLGLGSRVLMGLARVSRSGRRSRVLLRANRRTGRAAATRPQCGHWRRPLRPAASP